jgi:hypothetical protein
MDWSLKAERRLRELVCGPEDYSESQMAGILEEELGGEYTRNMVHSKIGRLDLTELESKPITPWMPYYDKYKEYYVNEGKEPEKKIIQLLFPYKLDIKDRDLQILSLNDLHIPFCCFSQVEEACNLQAAADILVVTEIMDCFSISRFNKPLSVPMELEIDNTIRLLEFFSSRFPLIIIPQVNHELRVEKAFLKDINPSLLFLVESNMLRRLAAPFPNIVVISNWFLQINDAILAHSEKFSKVELKAGVTVSEFFEAWREPLGLNPIHIIAQSHTHRLGSVYRGRVKIMETGCMAEVPQYAVAKMLGRPQNNGFCVIVQKKGLSDLNLSREYYLESPKYRLEDRFLGLT